MQNRTNASRKNDENCSLYYCTRGGARKAIDDDEDKKEREAVAARSILAARGRASSLSACGVMSVASLAVHTHTHKRIYAAPIHTRLYRGRTTDREKKERTNEVEGE